MPQSTGTRLQALYCTMVIDEPAPGVALVTIEGTDTGDLGDAPFRVLASIFGGKRRIELFIDARLARGPSIDVSNDWARWLVQHQNELVHVSMLTASRFVQLTADFVRSFGDLGDLMRIYTEPAVFEGALSNALGNARREA